jgi:uncharacterized repeat protein (TIGR03803 family)
MRRFARTSLVLPTLVLLALMVGAAQSAQAQTYQVIHSFTGGADGGNPYAGLTLDRAGNLYGTTFTGGADGGGTVYKLTHKGSGWAFDPLYSFGSAGGNDGGAPAARVIFGPDGSLYGTTTSGGTKGVGTVINLRPSPKVCKTSLCPWTETVLYSFKGGTDGANPGYGDLVFDQAGNIFGTTMSGGSTNPLGPCGRAGCGTVFELSPSNGSWNEAVIYAFQGNTGASPFSGVILDQTGNLYGTTYGGGEGSCNNGTCGTVYELTYSGSGWAESFLYSFTGGSNGDNPDGGLIFDPSGNLYGTTSNIATAFELTPSGGTWIYSLLYTFGGFDDQCGPRASLVMDAAGNLYGTTTCTVPNGTVFELTPSNDGTWTYTLLHGFTGPDGEYPECNVVIDANGNLYGTTSAGGLYGYGVVWEITP